MGFSHSPKIATDNLVFYYDTGNSLKSYKGEPTTNLASNPDFSNGTTGWNANQNVTLSVETINGTRFLKAKSNQTTSTPGFKSGNITVSGNTTYTLTIRAYKNDSKGIWLYATGNGTGGSDIVWTPAPNGPNPITTELTTISRTFTTPSDMTYLQIGALWANPLTTSEVYVEYMQLEQKSHATQFVNGTRSVTGSLLDLTGNKTINLTNSSFTSDALTAFDGSGDYFDLGSDQVFKTTGGWTVESVVNYDSVAGGYDNLISPANFIGSDSISYNSWYWSVLSRKLALWNISPGVWKYGSTTIEPNTWYHTALVCYDNGTQYQMYLNGVAEGGDHTTYSWNAAYSGLRVRYIGAGQSTRRYINGTVPVTKIYDRALSAEEVLQNFNATRSRFGM